MTEIHSLFVFFLIISSNFLGELFPCRIRKILTDNIWIKHFLGFLTLTFFVVLVEDTKRPKLENILQNSVLFYVIFLMLMKTKKVFFLMCMFFLSVLYMVHLIHKTESTILSDSFHTPIVNVSKILFLVSLVLGFFVYMGERKIEYKSKFDYLIFLFGKPVCRGKSPDISISKALSVYIPKL